MIWGVILILAAVLAAPFLREMLRASIAPRQKEAPGQFAQLRRGKLHYQWFGPEDGPVRVCIHGLTTASYVWGGMLPGLTQMGYRVLTFDHFGRGYSDRPRGAQDAAFYIEELTELLDQQGVAGPVTLIGYSMGGAIATVFAAAQPSKVQRVVLLAAAGLQAPPKGVAGFIRRVPVFGDWLMLVLYPSILSKGIKAERVLPTEVPGIGALQMAELNLRGFLPAVLSSFRGVLGRPLAAEHRAIATAQIPLHAIWGAKDDLIPFEKVQQQLSEWNPDAPQDVITEGTHAITYSHASEIVALIKAQAG